MSLSVIIFADNSVGLECFAWLVSNYKSDISLVVTTDNNPIHKAAIMQGLPVFIFRTEQSLLTYIHESSLEFDFGLLLWWPFIIQESLLKLTHRGFINTHPSLLPFNRGKHPNFWSIVSETPFGVTLHKVDLGIDTGLILAQKEIPISWTDTGESLYKKSLVAMFDLFTEFYPSLRFNTFKMESQPESKGSYHNSSELTKASLVSLDKLTTARDLLNRLRARTFSGHPACSFIDDDIEYEVVIHIKRKN